MNVQFVDKRNPTGTPLLTVVLHSPPSVGDHVTLNGRSAVVRSVHWVLGGDDGPHVAVVVE